MGVGQCQIFSPESWRGSRSHKLTSGDSGSVAAMNQGKDLPRSRPSGLGPTVTHAGHRPQRCIPRGPGLHTVSLFVKRQEGMCVPDSVSCRQIQGKEVWIKMT